MIEVNTGRYEDEDGRLFASGQDFEGAGFELITRGRVALHREPITTPNGGVLKRQWLSLGAGERLEIYHTPDHSPCSISFRVGSLLALGDLPFAANPGLCGLDGWNHADLMQTLRHVDWLIETAGVTVCCPGHGYCVAAESMQKKLRLTADEARDLSDIQLMNPHRIGALKNYADELLEEVAALFTIVSGRLYTASYYLSSLQENATAEQVLATFSRADSRSPPLRWETAGSISTTVRSAGSVAASSVASKATARNS